MPVEALVLDYNTNKAIQDNGKSLVHILLAVDVESLLSSTMDECSSGGCSGRQEHNVQEAGGE